MDWRDVTDVSSPPGQKRRSPSDLPLAKLAARQHGVVTVQQLREFGLGDSGIAKRVRTGRLHRVHRGVYSVGHDALPQRGRYLAAVLALGPGAALSHWSAAALWGLVDDVDAHPIDVTVAHDARARWGIRVHTVGCLPARDRRRVGGISVTAVARTLLDLADVVTPQVLRRALREAYVKRLTSEPQLSSVISGARGRHGAPRLAALISPGLVATRSELEDRVLDLLRSNGLPRPLVNARLAGLPRRVEVDFLFAEARLIVEADGARYHDNRLAREADASRQAMLEAAGYRVLRVTWSQVVREADDTVRRLRAAVGLAATGPRHSERS